MVSNLDPVSMIFALFLFNNYLATSAKRLGDSTINVHKNYGAFCIGSALISCFGPLFCFPSTEDSSVAILRRSRTDAPLRKAAAPGVQDRLLRDPQEAGARDNAANYLNRR
jgi:hypothetical protein